MSYHHYKRFVTPESTVTAQGSNHKAIVTHKGVFWGCGGCATKNAINNPVCVVCGALNA